MNSYSNVIYSAIATTACFASTKTYEKFSKKAPNTPSPTHVISASLLSSPLRAISAHCLSPSYNFPLRKLASSIGPTVMISTIESLTSQKIIKSTHLNRTTQTLLGSCLATSLTLYNDVWSIITAQRNVTNPFSLSKNITLKNLPTIFVLASARNALWIGLSITLRQNVETISKNHSNNKFTEELIKTSLTMLGALPTGIFHLGLINTVTTAYKHPNNKAPVEEVLNSTISSVKTKPGILSIFMRSAHAGLFSLILSQIESKTILNVIDNE